MFEWLLSAPAYVKVGLSFLGILLANGIGLPLGAAILLFSLLLSLWSGTGLAGLAAQIADLTKPDNYLLTAIVFLLLLFAEALNQSGRMARAIGVLKTWFSSRRLLLAGMPALIGLLPMPGGALFSAPLVGSADERNELDPRHKVAINYWFRHIWEYWWPLYPGVILAIRYSGLPLETFFLVQIPFTLVAVGGGYLFILRKVKKGDHSDAGERRLNAREVFSSLGPLVLLVFISLAGSLALPLVGITGTLANLLAMLAGLIMALVLIFAADRNAFAPSLALFKATNTWLLLLLVVSIQIFSGVLQHPLDGAGATLVSLMRDELIGSGVPLLTVIMVIPFISGLVTGVAFGFVGASFPIVFGLLGAAPGTAVIAATTACAYAFGYMGMMVSPLHVCFIVTGEYFKCSLYSSYRYIIGPIAVVLLASLLLSALYYLVL